MKKLIAICLVTAFGLSAVAGSPTPVREDVEMVNSAFSKKIYSVLLKTVGPTIVSPVGRKSDLIMVSAGGLSCLKSRSITCSIMADSGWTKLSQDSIYSANTDENSIELFNALKGAKSESEGDIETRAIELNVKDSDGGTERNLLTCISPTSEFAKQHFQTTCQLINAM